MKKYSEEIQRLLKTVVDDCDKEDVSVRERQIYTWKRLKLLWEGFSQIWYSEVAHDWRIYEPDSETDQGVYDKPVNVFRAYLESIIAALSIIVPPVKCYPDDADNPLDLSTARAGDQISELVYRHNNVSLLWLHALYIYCTEGMVACYSYSKSDKKYGMYDNKEYKDDLENRTTATCPNCGFKTEVDSSNQSSDGADICESCGQQVTPEVKTESFQVTRLVGITKEPKSKICLEAYGGLNIKISNYARRQEDCSYLTYEYEMDYSLALEKYNQLRKDTKSSNAINSGSTGRTEDQWVRLSPQYKGDYPTNVVTCKSTWLRPCKFNILNDEDDIKLLKKYFPDGVKVVYVNDQFAEAEPESLDDHWTILHNPLSDYIHFDPLGLLLSSIQEITNDIISLVLQTIEHGIGQTFADPAVMDFKAYSKTEVLPGSIIPTKQSTGKSIGEGFFELRTATLSAEVLPFHQAIQSLGQLVSGALPSLFGGQLEGSETASQYSMSRAQSMQRLQNTWKMFTSWWKEIFGKVIPLYIKEVKKYEEDERDVKRDVNGNFINVLIRKAELEGKIGKIELEANENIPLTWNQQKDVIEKLLQNANPEVMKILSAPENLPLIHQALGLTNLFVPGEADREKQYEEIKLLLNSEPITQPAQPSLDPMTGQMIQGQEQELPSIEIEPDVDDHEVHFAVCRKWLVSEAGRQAKADPKTSNGYKNILLHAKMHLQLVQQSMQSQQMNSNQENPAKAGQNTETPITGESNVSTVQ